MTLARPACCLARCVAHMTCVIVLASCGPPTTSLGTVVPFGFDLTGSWLVDEAQSDEAPDANAMLQREKSAEIEGKKSDSLASMYFLIRDFPIVSARRLTIEQDAESIGISYGEGQHRDLVWGLQSRAQWQLDAGWEGSHLVVKSVVSHSSVVERYQLQQDRTTLVVDVAVRAGGQRETYRRIFVKAD